VLPGQDKSAPSVVEFLEIRESIVVIETPTFKVERGTT
jgi:hypothetical protein